MNDLIEILNAGSRARQKIEEACNTFVFAKTFQAKENKSLAIEESRKEIGLLLEKAKREIRDLQAEMLKRLYSDQVL